MEQILVPAEYYLHVAPRLPIPEMAYGLCFDEHKDVLLVYENEILAGSTLAVGAP